MPLLAPVTMIDRPARLGRAPLLTAPVAAELFIPAPSVHGFPGRLRIDTYVSKVVA